MASLDGLSSQIVPLSHLFLCFSEATLDGEGRCGKDKRYQQSIDQN
jgi:hypothetical protein